MTDAEEFDVFLSHGSPDKPWVETLATELKALGLKPFLDVEAIEAPENFVRILNEGIARSRFLVLILSPHSDRAWVRQEWTSFLAHHGPEGRLVPVLLESTPVPALLAPVQRIDATDRDAARVAREIARIAGRPGELPKGDTRRLVLGQDLVFSLEMDGDDLRVTDPAGKNRTVTPPWKVDNRFGLALHFYERLTREPVTTDLDRADLFARATSLGGLLFNVLFDEEGRERLQQAMIPGRPRPLITIRSEEDELLALPWELLCQGGSFLLQDARVDLARSTGGEALLREPDGFLKLVVNVSAPEGSGLDYEGESYRVTKALSQQCRFVPTELGTVEDLLETVRAEKPTAIHFSGHGAPAALVFEDDEGREDVVPIRDLLLKLRMRIDGPLPPLFYLASCHGNDTGGSKAETSAACLHREGVLQVVGYNGPINDELSTRAEVAFYRALAEGATTCYAVRQAREALAEPSLPFAWAQLVFYHHGPGHPLSLPAAQGEREPEEALRRTFTGVGDRRVLSTGFIGRRSEMHEVRRRVRRGDRVFVFQGLGGLGKSTLAFHVLPMLQREEGEILALWCQEAEQQPNRLEALVGQLLDYCRKRFGLDWEQVVFRVDRTAGDDPFQRFSKFLQVLLRNMPWLVLYLDNLESLQIGPRDSEAEGDAEAIGEWASEDLRRLWDFLTALARQVENLYVVASCRYRNPDFGEALLPVSPLPPDALLRLMGWFPSLRQLSFPSQVMLVECLAGHPRAVEYADDLVAYAIVEHEDRYGPLQDWEPWHEWSTLVKPVLPKVRDKLRANLLLAEIWDRVLKNHERRMLYRMTLLRRPWEWSLMAVLGDEGEGEGAALATAERLARTSLLEQVVLLTRYQSGKLEPMRHFMLHPATVDLIRERFREGEAIQRIAHLRLGVYLEAEARKSQSLVTILEAGYHLFQAEEYNRAFEFLGTASEWLQSHGRVREGLRVLEPFFAEQVRGAMAPEHVGELLGTFGLAYDRMGEAEKSVGYQKQALVIAREIGDRQMEGQALGNLGQAYAALGELDEGIGYYEQQTIVVQDIGDRRGEGSALAGLGQAYHRLGELEKAADYYQQSLAITREIGDRQGEASDLGNLGLTCAALGNFGQAISYYQEQLVIEREIGDRQGEGRALGNLGLVYTELGELDKALWYFEQRLVIARETGDRRGEGNALGNVGNIYAQLGEMERAFECHKQQLMIGREIGDPWGQGNGLGNLGIDYARIGETTKAIALLEQALSIGQTVKDPQIIRFVSAALDSLHSAP